MKVLNLRHDLVSGGFRQSTVDLEFGDGTREQLWFRVPEEVPPPANGNAWLALALPLAAVIGEDLQIDLPVDAWLKLHAQTLLSIWRYWYPDLAKPVQIHAETLPPGLPKPGVVSSFTAGVDSFFTVLRHPECKHYIHVQGLDMPLWKKEAHARLTARLESIAAQMGARFFRLATNLRETRWGKLPWETFAAGAALAGSHLQMESAFGAGLIPSSELSPDIPWGSHPLTDPLFSTSSMRILHDGLSHTRLEKTEFVAQFPLVLENLHVCFIGEDTHGQDDRNCSRCEKCVRNMLALDAIGKLGECKTFDISLYRVELASQLEATSAKGQILIGRLRDLAERHGRADIASRLDESLRKSRILKALKRFERTPLLWRLPAYYRKRAFGALPRLQRLPAPSRPGSTG
ncbi:MAG: hypothetical protein KatS3mg005_4103 [Bryobacteraceae bacterium]|nr:MAG: hypothetical protein KatS3mg005_4103 [Bryobacteraceae bacterium]